MKITVVKLLFINYVFYLEHKFMDLTKEKGLLPQAGIVPSV